MPRLLSSLLRRAAAQSSYLPRLLLECRDLHSAENELRWLTEFAQHDSVFDNSSRPRAPRERLRYYVDRRSRGEPLQYILGTQPFGELEILCRPGVLIPRPETEHYTTELAKLIISARRSGSLCKNEQLRIADLCTGSGCIALLLHALLKPVASTQSASWVTGHPDNVHLLGVDVSPLALNLAKDNLRHNVRAQLLQENARDDVDFCQLDVLAMGLEAAWHAHPIAAPGNAPRTYDASTQATSFLSQRWPIIISNPPYISPRDFAPGGDTARSVREYEPKLALVPPVSAAHVSQDTPLSREVEQADTFYETLLFIARAVNTELLLMEVGGIGQAFRVVDLARNMMLSSWRTEAVQPTVIEIWSNNGDVVSWKLDEHAPTIAAFNDDNVTARAVVIWRGPAAEWRYSNS